VVTALDKNNNEAGDFTEPIKFGVINTKVNELVINSIADDLQINIENPNLQIKKSI
jgi:hypothetical protein